MDHGAGSYRRFLDGDEGAFDEITKEYRDSLTFFIERYVHDIAAAEDIAIDVFCDLIVHRHRYNFKTNFKTYLFMMGRSRALDYIKHRNKLVFSELSEAESELLDKDSLETAVLNHERKRMIHRAMAQLPEEMRIVIHLIFFEDLSYRETAKIMKKSPKQIDNLLYRAKNSLRNILGEEGEQFL